MLPAQLGRAQPRLMLFQGAPSQQIAAQSPAGQRMICSSLNPLRLMSVSFDGEQTNP
jgi:hypothetical protein